MTLSLRDQKQQQRDTAFARRASIVAGNAGVQAARHFIEAFPSLDYLTVSLYWPLGSELDSRPLLRVLHEMGADCALPVVEKKDHPLLFRRWTPETVMEPGAFNVMVPVKSADYVIPGLVITPMLAFDAMGNRLGYGGGFYDRTLEILRNEAGSRAIGLAYAAQEVERVVTDRFDQRLDGIITEKDFRIIK